MQLLKEKKVLVIIGIIAIAVIGWFIFNNTGTSELVGTWTMSTETVEFRRNGTAHWSTTRPPNIFTNITQQDYTWEASGGTLVLRIEHADGRVTTRHGSYEVVGSTLILRNMGDSFVQSGTWTRN